MNTDNETFDPSFFDILRKAESDHFWFSVRRKWIYDKIRKFLPPPAEFLEVGCGTGNVVSFMGSKGYTATGCEFYAEALQLAWPGFRRVHGDASNLPFSPESFDIVGLFDVIEHFQDDSMILREAARVLRKDGIMTVSVPAREELWSRADEISMHKRRYTIDGLKKLLRESDLEVLLMEYMFMGLYIPTKYSRSRNIERESNPFKIGGIVNRFFKSYFGSERLISRVLPPPIGTSLIAIACKKKLPNTL